jgi:hypothetical protein
LGAQHIGQGTQWYFCFEERMRFAEILFQICGLVIDSDSNFGSSLGDVLV